MEKILAQARKVAEEAEVFLVSAEETPVQFEANRLKNVQGKQSTSVALRIIKNGRLGYATGTDVADVQSLVENAVETAKFGTRARFELPPATPYPKVDIFDPAVESASVEKMARLGEELIALITGHTPEIVCEAEVEKETFTLRIINSRGGQASYKKSIFSIGVVGNLIRG
ncbi:MAG TPA: DNA gyrase modulator, partial [Dehalococcoidales bacterium]|nr:DNA gyrase modulator [Dehalococcoidales bacterium]